MMDGDSSGKSGKGMNLKKNRSNNNVTDTVDEEEV